MLRILIVSLVLIFNCTLFKPSLEGYTRQNLSNALSLKPNMSKSQVQSVMGSPVKTEFSSDFSAWHYCCSGYGSDEFVVVIFFGDKLIETRNYNVTYDEVGTTGDCPKFVKSVDFSSVKKILSSNIEPVKTEPLTSKSGTAWLLDSGYIVTNYHVISGTNKSFLIDRNKNEIPLDLVAKDQSNDIALLRAKSFINKEGISLSTRKADLGTDVFTVGYPHSEILGSSQKLTIGIINSQTGFMDDPRTYQISVPVQAGNSGGPLINKNGEAVGIVTYKLNALQVFMWTGDLPENVNYAIKSSYLQLLLNDYTKLRYFNTDKNESKSVTDIYKQLESKVFQIISK